MPFVVLEPSCASVFRDELINFFPANERAQRLAKQTFLLSEILAHHAPGYRPPQLSGAANGAPRPLPPKGADGHAG